MILDFILINSNCSSLWAADPWAMQAPRGPFLRRRGGMCGRFLCHGGVGGVLVPVSWIPSRHSRLGRRFGASALVDALPPSGAGVALLGI